MHLTDLSRGALRLVRDRRRASAGRHWVPPSRRQYPGTGTRLPGVLRRRSHEHRRVSRGAEPRRGLETPGHLPLREQPVRRVLARARDHRRSSGSPTAPASYGDAGRHGRRKRRRRLVHAAVPEQHRPGPAGDGPDADRGADLPPHGHSRRTRASYRPAGEVAGVAGTGPDRPARDGAGRARRGAEADWTQLREAANDRSRGGGKDARWRGPSRTRDSDFEDVVRDEHRDLPGTRSRQALADALSRRPEGRSCWARTSAAAGGVFKTTDGLFAQFGAGRVLRYPDFRAGDRRDRDRRRASAACGRSPSSCSPTSPGSAIDQIANQLAKYRYMTGGQVELPVTLRLANGGRLGFAAQHSQPVENWFLNVPGLKIAVPGHAGRRVSACCETAIVDDDDPVLFFEHKALFGRRRRCRTQRSCSRSAGRGGTGRSQTSRSSPTSSPGARPKRRPRPRRRGHFAELIDPRHAGAVRRCHGDSEHRADLEGRLRAGLTTRRKLGARHCWRGSRRPVSTSSTPRRSSSAPTRHLFRTPQASNSAWLPTVDRIVTEVRKLASY